MRYLSLFSGIEAASLAWQPLGWEPMAFSEVDKFCCELLRQRFPDVPNLGDVTAPDFIDRAKALGPIDLIVGGSPCQAFSLAGLRKGLRDDRGNLTLRFVEVVRDLRPEYVVWENVPGILSMDGGAVFENLLDAFLSLGYTVDCDILDAQYFGVAQRRRRVFVVCRRADRLMSERTPTSALTFASLVVQVSLNILAALRAESGSVDVPLGSRRASAADGLRRKMLCFSLAGDNCFGTWLDNSADVLSSVVPAPGSSGSEAGRGTATATPSDPIETGTGSSDSSGRTDRASSSSSTKSSLRKCWADLFGVVRSYTTSTATNSTTEERTWLCLEAVVLTARCILPLDGSSPIFSFVASSLSTAILEATGYARLRDEPLLDEPEVHARRSDLLREADDLRQTLRRVGDGDGSTLLPLAAGVRRDPPTRRAKGEGTAGYAASGIGVGGAEIARPIQGTGPGAGSRVDLDSGAVVACFGGNRTSGEVDVATACNAHGGTGRHDFESETFVAHSLRADGFDASEDGTGRRTPLVPVCFSSKDHGADAGEIAPTLRAAGHDGSHANAGAPPAICQAFYLTESRCDNIPPPGVSPPLKVGSSGGCGKPPAVAVSLRGRDGGGTAELGGEQSCAVRASQGGGDKPHVLCGRGNDDGHAEEAGPVEALRMLREAVGEEAFCLWCLGILAAFWPKEVLRSAMHGSGIRCPSVPQRGLLNVALARSQVGSAWSVRDLWEAGCDGCPPQGSESYEQLAGQLGAYLSELPHAPAPSERLLRCLWRSCEGSRLLRETLSAVEEARRSECIGMAQEETVRRVRSAGEREGTVRQALHAGQASAYVVRRLVPEETEALQGMPRGWTLITVRGKPAADGPRYKSIGNSFAVPVVRWIGERIASCIQTKPDLPADVKEALARLFE